MASVTRLNGEQYLKKIYNFYKTELKYPELVEKTVKNNLSKFYVDLKEIEHTNEIIFTAKVIKMLFNSPSIYEIDLIIKEFNININIFINNYSEMKQKTDEIFILLRKSINERLKLLKIDINHYRYLDYNETKTLEIFNYEIYCTLEKGSCFGEMALNTNHERNATIEGNNPKTYLGLIQHSIYNEYIAKEKLRIGMMEMSFFIDNFFFQPINKELFKNKYFYDFIYFESKKFDSLHKEKECLKNIYFTKEGEIELTFQMSLEELNKFIFYNSRKYEINIPKIPLDDNICKINVK